MSRTSHRIAQVFLFLLWIGILMLDISPPVESQTCGNRPQFYNPLNPPPKSYWTPDTTNVIVKMDSFFSTLQEDAISRLIDGNEKWNSPLTCSLVHFTNFETVFFTSAEYLNAPPMHHVYWQVDDPQSPFNGGVFIESAFGGFVFSARVKIKLNIVIPDPRYFNYLGTHEIGHTFGLDDCLSTKNPPCVSEGLTIMGGHTNSVFDTQGPTACDFAKVRELYCPTPSPTPTPSAEPSPWYWPYELPPLEVEPCQNGGWFWNFSNNTCNQEQSGATCAHHCVPYQPLDSGGCYDAADYCAVPYGCPPGTVDGGAGCCCFPTPVLIDVSGDGFSLTDAYSGVMFDMGGDGRKEPVAWTASNTDDAWLAYDRNGNGHIDSGKELFGNFTDQPHATTTRNGFLALAEFDMAVNGGNHDGVISRNDSVFSSLLLWQDVNKNGVSEPSELHTLEELRLTTIELAFKESKKTDEHDNKFRYRAKVRDVNKNQLGRWAWDVIIQANPPRRP